MVCQVSFARPDMTASGLSTLACLRFVGRLTECLHGSGSLREALHELRALALAEVVHLHRVNIETGTQRSIASLDLNAAQGARPLTRGLGMALAGQTPSRAKPGTLWSLQEMDEGAAARLDPRVLSWMEARGLHEAMLIPLSTRGDETDLIELFLTAPIDAPRRRLLDLLAAAAAETWDRRPEGRISGLLRAAPAISARANAPRASQHPLSLDNPYGMTAAELRICGSAG